jgi:hypothetical protein
MGIGAGLGTLGALGAAAGVFGGQKAWGSTPFSQVMEASHINNANQMRATMQSAGIKDIEGAMGQINANPALAEHFKQMLADAQAQQYATLRGGASMPNQSAIMRNTGQTMQYGDAAQPIGAAANLSVAPGSGPNVDAAWSAPPQQ